MSAIQKRKLQIVEEGVDEHEVALLLASQQQQPHTSDKRESKKGKIFEKHDAPVSTFNAQQKDGKLRLPNKVHRSHSAPEVHDTTPTPQVIGEGTVAAFKMPNGSMILLDEHTQFLHTDDMIKLGSLVPGCEPIIECPKSVVYKARDYIVHLRKEVEMLRGYMKTRQLPLISQNGNTQPESLPSISSIVDAPKSSVSNAN